MFEDGGSAVPVHGVLEDDDVGLFEGGLFGGDVDLEVGVELVDVPDFVSGLGGGIGPGAIDARGGEVGVEDVDEEAGSGRGLRHGGDVGFEYGAVGGRSWVLGGGLACGLDGVAGGWGNGAGESYRKRGNLRELCG